MCVSLLWIMINRAVKGHRLSGPPSPPPTLGLPPDPHERHSQDGLEDAGGSFPDCLLVASAPTHGFLPPGARPPAALPTVAPFPMASLSPGHPVLLQENVERHKGVTAREENSLGEVGQRLPAPPSCL